jgi:hypothetical protein
MTTSTIELRESLIATAAAENSEFPQYDNFWASWDVAVVTATINDKWGDLMASVGEHVLIKPAGCCVLSGLPETVIYLDAAHHWSGKYSTSGCNTVISPGYVKRVAR